MLFKRTLLALPFFNRFYPFSQIKSSGNQVLVVGLGEGLARAPEMEQAPLGEAPYKHAKCNWRKMQRQRQPRCHCVLLSPADPLGVLEEMAELCLSAGVLNIREEVPWSPLLLLLGCGALCFNRESMKLRARRALSRNAVKHEHFDLLVQIFCRLPLPEPRFFPLKHCRICVHI